MSGARIVTIADGALFALTNEYPADGRVSTQPLDHRGTTSANSYLFREGDDAVLLDPGLTIHQDDVASQVQSLLGERSSLRLCIVRVGEFQAVCNVRPMIERFDVRTVYGAQDNSLCWSDFRPDLVPYGEDVGGGGLSGLDEVRIRKGSSIGIGDAGRRLVVVDAPLRLLPVAWMYDEGSRTLLTADAFTYAVPAADGSSWVVDAECDDITVSMMLRHMLATRFWWVAGADTAQIREGLAAVFEEYDVHAIAPAFGSLIVGREVVRRHVALMDEALRLAAQMDPIGLDADRWSGNWQGAGEVAVL